MGISSVIVEDRSREYCEGRIRAGVLEDGSVEVLTKTGVGERMHREGLVHNGIYLRFNGKSHHIDFPELTGKRIMVYGQHECVKDMIAARLAQGGEIHFESSVTSVEKIDTDRPEIRYRDAAGNAHVLTCDFIAGCDGFHGISRPSFPAGVLSFYDRIYPFAWLGILTDAPQVCDELIYVHTERGFALFSQRSETVQRYYLQCAPEEDINNWSDDRIWSELQTRLDGEDKPNLIEGPITQKSITPMRSFVTEPMQYGRLFLAGDSAHIVPPTGAKGMNLAVGDVVLLARGLESYYKKNSMSLLDNYSATAIRRVWKYERFSWWMTTLLHKFDGQIPFDAKVQLGELDYYTSSRAGMESLAEQYVGLPML
jgi:p-hydroxybenzoate 3-monooxygenase